MTFLFLFLTSIIRFADPLNPGRTDRKVDQIEDVERGAELRVRSMDSKTAGYPRFRLFTPNPPDFFLMGCSLTKKKQAVPPASMLAD